MAENKRKREEQQEVKDAKGRYKLAKAAGRNLRQPSKNLCEDKLAT